MTCPLGARATIHSPSRLLTPATLLPDRTDDPIASAETKDSAAMPACSTVISAAFTAAIAARAAATDSLALLMVTPLSVPVVYQNPSPSARTIFTAKDALIESGLSDKAKKNTVRTDRCAPHFLRSGRQDYFAVRAATPGRTFPSRNSRDAPPPVETWLISAALPLFLTALTESPPPMIEVPPFALTVATASQTP